MSKKKKVVISQKELEELEKMFEFTLDDEIYLVQQRLKEIEGYLYLLRFMSREKFGYDLLSSSRSIL